MTITETAFALLDTETGGVDDASDLLEIAARFYGTAAGFQTLVRPTKPVPPEASAIHHLIDADFEGAPGRDVAIEQLVAFVGDSVIVAHNAPFDRAQVAPALADHRWLCSERLAHHLMPDAPNFKLPTLYYVLGGPKIEDALHRASADLRITEFVFGRLIDLYTAWAVEKCAGDAARLAKSAEIESLLAFAERPYIQLRPPFGKYKTWDALLADRGYLRWMIRLPDLSPDTRWNIAREQRRRGMAA